MIFFSTFLEPNFDLSDMNKISKSEIHAATEIIRLRQNHPPLSEWQLNTVEMLVNQNNSVSQLPTGSGKTWPVISLPSILDVLRDNLKQEVPEVTRVLYIVPLVNIFHSLSSEMEALEIPHQILSCGGGSKVDDCAKVVCVSPEKLLEKSVMSSILQLSWSAVSIDEPHLGKPSKLIFRQNEYVYLHFV